MHSIIVFFKNTVSCHKTFRKTDLIQNLPFKKNNLIINHYEKYQSLSKNYEFSFLLKQNRIHNKIK